MVALGLLSLSINPPVSVADGVRSRVKLSRRGRLNSIFLQCYQRKVLRVSEQLNASPLAKLQSCHASPWGFSTHLTAASITAVCRPPRIALQKSMITCTGGDFFFFLTKCLLYFLTVQLFFPTHCSVCVIAQNAQNRKTLNVCIFKWFWLSFFPAWWFHSVWRQFVQNIFMKTWNPLKLYL